MAKKIQDGNQIVTNVDSNDNLTFSIKNSFIDSTPTANSTNLVTSGGVKSALDINTTDIGTLSNLTTTSKTNLVSAINELETDKLETSAIVNEASTEIDEVYSSDYLNDKLVSVGATAPENGERVWFKKGKNLLDEKTLRQGSGYDPTTTNRVFFPSNYYLEPGTYTLYTNLNTTNYKYAIGIASKEFPNIASDVYDSGWQTLDHVTFTLSQSGYLGVGVAKSDGTSDITPSDISNYHFMLCKGSYDSTIPYSPYIEPSINVDGEKWVDKVNDTGWVDISNYVNTSNFKIRGGDTIKVRRIGNIVYFKGEIYCKTALSSHNGNIMLGIPSVFRPTNQYSRCGVKYDLGVPYNIFISNNGNITISENQNISVTPDYKGYQLTNLSGFLVD